MHTSEQTPTSRSQQRGIVLILAALVILGIALRVWLAWWMGNLGDLQAFQSWALEPSELRGAWERVTPVANNSPPLYPALLRLLRWTHQAFALPGDFTQPLR